MSRNLNSRTIFQCFACKARTKQGDFNEAHMFECYPCFRARLVKYQEARKAAMQKRKT